MGLAGNLLAGRYRLDEPIGRSGGGWYDGTVRVWDLAGDQGQTSWIADGGVLAVVFSAARIMVGDKGGQVHALELNVPAAASA